MKMSQKRTEVWDKDVFFVGAGLLACVLISMTTYKNAIDSLALSCLLKFAHLKSTHVWIGKFPVDIGPTFGFHFWWTTLTLSQCMVNKLTTVDRFGLFFLPPPPASFTSKITVPTNRLTRKLACGLIGPWQTYLVFIINLVKPLITS